MPLSFTNGRIQRGGGGGGVRITPPTFPGKSHVAMSSLKYYGKSPRDKQLDQLSPMTSRWTHLVQLLLRRPLGIH